MEWEQPLVEHEPRAIGVSESESRNEGGLSRLAKAAMVGVKKKDELCKMMELLKEDFPEYLLLIN